MSSAPLSSPAPKPLLTIERQRGWVPLNLPEIWRFRDLMFTLAGRDIRLRYRQTALGVAWVVLQPLLAAGLFSFVFGLLARLPDEGVPYFVLSYAGMLAFNVFNNTLTRAGTCLVGNAQLVSKVYFPRMILPLSTAISTLLDFTVAGIILVIMLVFYRHQIHLGWGLLLLPVWVSMLLMLALGIGLWASALTVSYRDVQYILPVLLQFVMYASPVGYGVAIVLQKLKPKYIPLYFMNPLASLLEAFRWSCLGVGELRWGYLGYSLAFSVAALIFGGFAFKRMERKFADVI